MIKGLKERKEEVKRAREELAERMGFKNNRPISPITRESVIKEEKQKSLNSFSLELFVKNLRKQRKQNKKKFWIELSEWQTAKEDFDFYLPACLSSVVAPMYRNIDYPSYDGVPGPVFRQCKRAIETLDKIKTLGLYKGNYNKQRNILFERFKKAKTAYIIKFCKTEEEKKGEHCLGLNKDIKEMEKIPDFVKKGIS